jgi:PilZ domain
VYDRSPLILDAEDHPLAPASTSLSVLGHRPVYSDDLDELLIMARECEGRVGALLLPAAHAFTWWSAVRKDLVEPLGISPRSVLPVGPKIDPTETEGLQREGVRWALRDPFSPWDLRFAVSQVLSESDLFELRFETRVPCVIPVELDTQELTTPAHLTDLSSGGAFVQLAHPKPTGTPVVIRGDLCGRPVSLPARVAWRSGAHTPPWRDRGMGLEFEALDADTAVLVREQVDRALGRFRIEG